MHARPATTRCSGDAEIGAQGDVLKKTLNFTAWDIPLVVRFEKTRPSKTEEITANKKPSSRRFFSVIESIVNSISISSLPDQVSRFVQLQKPGTANPVESAVHTWAKCVKLGRSSAGYETSVSSLFN